MKDLFLFYGGSVSSGKKVAFSLFLSVLFFSVFVLLAYTEFFQVIEARFYQPMVLASYEKKLEALSDAFYTYIEPKKRLAFSYASDPAVRNTSSPSQKKEDIETIENKTGALLSDGNGLLGVRIIGNDGRKIHYSSFAQDILKKEPSRIQYETYSKLEELEYEAILCERDRDFKIFFDSRFERIVLSLALFDNFNIYQGSIVFYYSALSIEQAFIADSLISLSESVAISEKGLVIGLPEKGKNDFKLDLAEALADSKQNLYPQFSVNDELFLFLSYRENSLDNGIVISQLIKEKFVVFNETIKIVLSICFFITVFLMLLFLFSLKSDATLIIRQRIKKFQFALLNEYLETKEKINWNDVISSIESRKLEVALSLKNSLGKKAKKHQALVDALLEKSWDEIMASLTKSKENFVQNVQVDTSEIRAMLEEILLSTRQGGDLVEKRQLPAKKVVEVEVLDELSEIEEVEELDELAELEEVEELDEVSEIEEVEELDELTELEEVEELDELSELEEVEELDEVSEIEEVEELDELSEIEEVEEVEELDEVSEIEEVEELDELSEIEEVEELDELAELEEVEELDEISEIEEVEELDEISELEEVEELDEVSEIEEVEEVEEIDELAELEEVEELDEVSELEEVEELDELTEIEEVELDSFINLEELENKTLEAPQKIESHSLDIFKEELTLGSPENESFEKNLQKSNTDALFNLDIAFPDFSSLDSIKTETDDEAILATIARKRDTKDASGIESIIEKLEAEEAEEIENLDEYEELESSELVQYIDDNAAFSFALQFNNPHTKLENLRPTDETIHEKVIEKIKEPRGKMKHTKTALENAKELNSIIENDGIFSINKDIYLEDIETDSDFVNLVDSVRK